MRVIKTAKLLFARHHLFSFSANHSVTISELQVFNFISLFSSFPWIFSKQNTKHTHPYRSSFQLLQENILPHFFKWHKK